MTMKRVLLKGEFFAEWDGTLDEAAALAGVPVSDLAFHPDDLLAEVQELRRQAYRTESDPLRLEAEFDAIAAGAEPDLAAWVAAVQAIKARYPLPEQVVVMAFSFLPRSESLMSSSRQEPWDGRGTEAKVAG